MCEMCNNFNTRNIIISKSDVQKQFGYLQFGDSCFPHSRTESFNGCLDAV
jgi:hypothetical protein